MKYPDVSPLRKSPRLAGFDYSTAGSYFITICTKNMERRFGRVENGDLILNDVGYMVASLWKTNIDRYSGAAQDAFIVMPIHVHAIVFIGTGPHMTGAGASLTRIVQSFKSLTTVEYTRGVHSGVYEPYSGTLWQRSFHDRILRDERALDSARLYIEGNPSRWEAHSRCEQQS